MTPDGLLVADWGTTNLRAWRLDAAGAVLDSADFPLGVSRLGPGDAPIRFARDVVPALKAEGLPALLCGMVGSTLGWAVAPSVDCPAAPEALARGLLEVAPGVRIVPGLRCEGLIGPDVMRGEETQVLGWLAGEPARAQGSHLLCLPGTHSKWVRLEDGAVRRFATAMTGELFGLLRAHSVLRSPPGAEGAQAFDLESFDRGVAAAGDGGALTARLFGVRGLTLGGDLTSATSGAFLSGLLIGAEIAALWPMFREGPGEAVSIVGDGRLASLYVRAIAARGGVTVAAYSGSEAALGGLRRIWEASR